MQNTASIMPAANPDSISLDSARVVLTLRTEPRAFLAGVAIVLLAGVATALLAGVAKGLPAGVAKGLPAGVADALAGVADGLAGVAEDLAGVGADTFNGVGTALEGITEAALSVFFAVPATGEVLGSFLIGLPTFPGTLFALSLVSGLVSLGEVASEPEEAAVT